MKKIFYLPALAALCLCSLNSCSDNDDNNPDGVGSTIGSIDDINPTKVFTEGLPSQINGQQVKTDSKGRVISIGNNFSIEYLSNDGRSATSTESYNVILRDDTGYPKLVFYGIVNESGFLRYLKTESLSDLYEYVINYNSNGQISYLQEIYTDSKNDGEVEKETYTWTYKDQNMTRLSYSGYDSDDKFKIDYSYTGSNNSAIANKGSYIFMQTFDIDDHSYFPKTAYYAGLLGKSTKNLIVNAKWNDGEEDKYSWQLDSSGYPASVTVNIFDDGELETTHTTNFQW